MFRRILMGAVAAGLVAVFTVGTAAAAPATTTTSTRGLVDTFVDVLPTCDDSALYTITTTSNLVEHQTLFSDGREHDTFTQTGKFVAVPLDPSLPSYTGRFTTWGNFNLNNESVLNDTFITSISGTGSDGSMLRANMVGHENQRPDGTVNAFFHCQ